MSVEITIRIVDDSTGAVLREGTKRLKPVWVADDSGEDLVPLTGETARAAIVSTAVLPLNAAVAALVSELMASE